MSRKHKNDNWVFGREVQDQAAGPGAVRRVLAYCDELMCVENHFEAGASGALHSHPHTQITYVVDGVFEFNIAGQVRVVRKGDSMLKQNGVEHGCTCLEKGTLLDMFTPLRQDFVS